MNKFPNLQLETSEECKDRVTQEAAEKAKQIWEEYYNGIVAANAEYQEQYADAYADYELTLEKCKQEFDACLYFQQHGMGTLYPNYRLIFIPYYLLQRQIEWLLNQPSFNIFECHHNFIPCLEAAEDKFDGRVDYLNKQLNHKRELLEEKRNKHLEALKKELEANLKKCEGKPIINRGKNDHLLLREYPPLNE